MKPPRQIREFGGKYLGESPSQTERSMAKVVQIAKNLSIPHIVALLKSLPEDKLSTLPPVKPRGGEVYLYQAKEDPDTKKGRLSFNNQVKTKSVFKSYLLT